MEAATRAVEKIGFSKGKILRPTTECWEKDNPKRSTLYNTYWILVNAAHYKEAERLRDKFKTQSECDLAKEPICSTKKMKK